jgi:hypothetical protein
VARKDDVADGNGNPRRAIVFDLVALDDELAAPTTEGATGTGDPRWTMPIDELRTRSARTLGEPPTSTIAKRNVYQRSGDALPDLPPSRASRRGRSRLQRAARGETRGNRTSVRTPIRLCPFRASCCAIAELYGRWRAGSRQRPGVRIAARPSITRPHKRSRSPARWSDTTAQTTAARAVAATRRARRFRRPADRARALSRPASQQRRDRFVDAPA